jgi:metal-responsive CopG/Arc/MetJ family transcriptional regulator
MIKFGVEIPKDLNDKLNELIPWGLKSRLFRNMLVRLEYEVRNGGDKTLQEWMNWSKPL